MSIQNSDSLRKGLEDGKQEILMPQDPELIDLQQKLQLVQSNFLTAEHESIIIGAIEDTMSSLNLLGLEKDRYAVRALIQGIFEELRIASENNQLFFEDISNLIEELENLSKNPDAFKQLVHVGKGEEHILPQLYYSSGQNSVDSFSNGYFAIRHQTVAGSPDLDNIVGLPYELLRTILLLNFYGMMLDDLITGLSLKTKPQYHLVHFVPAIKINLRDVNNVQKLSSALNSVLHPNTSAISVTHHISTAVGVMSFFIKVAENLIQKEVETTPSGGSFATRSENVGETLSYFHRVFTNNDEGL